MKIVEYNKYIHPKSWRGKTNFVDINNVVVGFDDYQLCCENFGWFLSSKSNCDNDSEYGGDTTGDIPDTYNTEPYTFDTSFNGGGVFKLVADGLPTIYLVLYNHHNGYYSHGFDMTVGGKLQLPAPRDPMPEIKFDAPPFYKPTEDTEPD